MSDYTRLNVSFKSDVLLEELVDEAVLLNLETEHYFGLDSIGVRFWQLLKEHGNSEDVVQAVLAEYDIEKDAVYQDVAKFIVKLEQAGLLIIETD